MKTPLVNSDSYIKFTGKCNCHKYAKCETHKGVHKCMCNEGYEGNGVDCKGGGLNKANFYYDCFMTEVDGRKNS